VGWVVIAMTVLISAIVLHPAVWAAERFLTTHALDPSSTTA
jgi:hypothetical protein